MSGHWSDRLAVLGEEKKIITWAREYETPEMAWAERRNPIMMMWMLGASPSAALEQHARSARLCAELAIRAAERVLFLVPTDEVRPAAAVRVARAAMVIAAKKWDNSAHADVVAAGEAAWKAGCTAEHIERMGSIGTYAAESAAYAGHSVAYAMRCAAHLVQRPATETWGDRAVATREEMVRDTAWSAVAAASNAVSSALEAVGSTELARSILAEMIRDLVPDCPLADES